MRNSHVTPVLAVALWLAPAIELRAGDVSTIDYPYVGVTHVFRVGSTPDFPRNVNIHVIQIDLSAPFLSFQYTPHAGTRDTLRKTTLQFLNDMGAQIAINGHFFLPFPSSDFNSALVGFAASNGDIYSPFELPNQNYALVRDSPAINIDPNNNASVVHRDPAYSDGTCYGLCQIVDGLHVLENVTIWNAFSGSAQIVTNGVKTIPCYVDQDHPNCQLVGPGPANYSNSNSWYELTNARTSIGLSCNNKTLVLFTVDRAGGSEGMKVSEVADLLIRDYGVCNALNMDGGGSTSLAMRDPATGIGAYLNTSSDNPNGRADASGLAVFAARDTQPPVISGMPKPGCTLWPPNGKLVHVATVTAVDALSGLGSLTVVGTSNEPLDPGDVVVTSNGSGTSTVQLRADRLGTGTGRTYTLTATATDLAGNTQTATGTCTVPHDQGKN